MALKYVITGGPGVGKTTLVDALGKRGYTTVQEAARLLNEMGIPVAREMDKVEEFQMKVLEVQLELEARIPENSLTFLDRGIPDGIAYFWLHDLEPNHLLLEKSFQSNYQKIFFLRPLRNYEKDDVRWEDKDLALRIQSLTRKAYEFIGYTPIDIPAMSVEERIEYVLKRV